MEAADWLTDTDTRARLERVSTATVTTQLMKRGFRSRFMRDVAPLRPGMRMLGPARTLRYAPMREDLDTLESLGARTNAQRILIEDIDAGEVLVIDGLGQTGAGSLGSILALRLQVRGAAGIVTDGAFRDTPGIRELAIPSYARGQNANTNLTLYHPADIDCIVGCGGVMVEPGDAVLGDDEGVVVIPRHLVAEVARDALEQEVREHFIYERVSDGASVFDVYPLNGDEEERFRVWRGEGEAIDRHDTAERGRHG
jgi:regulator of RNase E activity RraA